MTQFDGKSEREQLLIDLVHLLARTVLELGADGTTLRSRLSAVRQAAFAAGKTDAVKAIDRLMDELFPPPETPLKPQFRII